MNQSTSIHPKVVAGTTVAAVATAVFALIAAFGVAIPSEVQDAAIVIAGFLGGYIKSA